jgi:hypothetical protein
MEAGTQRAGMGWAAVRTLAVPIGEMVPEMATDPEGEERKRDDGQRPQSSGQD